MPDGDNPGQSETDGAPAVTPALTAEDIQGMINKGVEDATERRIRGMQSTHATQLAALRQEVVDATADPDRFDADARTKLETQLATSRQETDALRVATQYPEAFPVYEAILSAKTPKEQLDILQAYVRQGGAPAQDAQGEAPGTPAAPGAAPIVPAPPDLIRPVLDQTTEPPLEGGGMTQQLADQIIDGIGPIWPKFGN